MTSCKRLGCLDLSRNRCAVSTASLIPSLTLDGGLSRVGEAPVNRLADRSRQHVLDEDRPFYFVADGVVQVARAEHPIPYAGTVYDGLKTSTGTNSSTKSAQVVLRPASSSFLWSMPRSAGPMTRAVQMANTTQPAPPTTLPAPTLHTSTPQSNRTALDVSMFDLDGRGQAPISRSARPTTRREHISSSGSTIHPSDAPSPDLSTGLQSRVTPSTARPRVPHRHASLHYGVVARAKQDTTLTVMTAETFQRLTKKFPKATAHIVWEVTSFLCKVMLAVLNFARCPSCPYAFPKGDVQCGPQVPWFGE